MSRCPYPDCWADEEHDGDHQLGRPPLPRGELRCVWEYSHRCGRVRCSFGMKPWQEGYHPDLDHGAAVGFYVDMLGFGWELCYRCVQVYGAVIDFTTVDNNAPLTATRIKAQRGIRPSVRLDSIPSTPTPRAKVLEFTARQRTR